MPKRRKSVEATSFCHAAAFGLLSVLLSGCALSLTGDATPDPVQSGGTLTYQFVASEDFDLSTAPLEVCVTHALPAGVTLQSATTSTGSGCSGDPLVCNLGVMGASQTSTVTITVTVDAAPPALLSSDAVVALCVCGTDPTCNGQTPDDPSDNGVSLATSVIECLSDGDCDDANPATMDQCQVDFTCAHVECQDDGDCDDGSNCTIDSCNAGACNHAALGPPTCPLATKAKLTLKDDPGDDAKDKLVFKLESSALMAFPDPMSNPVEFCLADGLGQVVLKVPVGAGPPWQQTSSGYTRTDPSGATSGVTKIVVKPAKAKLVFKGKGTALPDLSPAGVLSQPISAYLATGPLSCAGSQLVTVKKNDGEKLKAQYP